MTQRRALISGASIAGPALAFWLNRYGWETTVVERAAEVRTGGQNIDVRGAARETLRRAGLEDVVRAATTGELGTRFVRADGSTAAEFPAGESDTEGATAEVEILRGDLAQILIDASMSKTEYVFGDAIAGVEETTDGVRVSFEKGQDREYDLVIVAEGKNSTTRSLLFRGAERAEVRDLGMEMAYLTIPRTDGDVDWWRWYSAPGGRGVTLRPDRHGTTRAVLSRMTHGRASGFDRRDAAGQKSALREQFGDAGWEATRVLDALDGADVYFESLGQVHAPTWSTGRVALTGDAAWCASPVSGMGTSLSLVGAYVLAGELSAHVDHRDAFRGYERILRPYVEQAQDPPPGTPRLANPSTRAGIAALHGLLRAASTKAVAPLRSRMFRPPAEKIELPDYGHLEARV
ncbi:FAD-binding monooxygenase [Frondihabitans sucicola]|uniref:FAD-binding monooxygenase n=1 Tax=Frondihabitans sucicola TaxID=1268041 RepID=A0ABM8GJ81_9MICO|nr:FAD-dependent monooxygenase [Frondihabitans sucicola]BDZ48448.1 FAD-binding monooxygenase [Frondihabitans sucicola]